MKRYDQCYDDCTTDCGHCKGAGRPVASVDKFYAPRVDALLNANEAERPRFYLVATLLGTFVTAALAAFVHGQIALGLFAWAVAVAFYVLGRRMLTRFQGRTDDALTLLNQWQQEIDSEVTR